MASPLRPSARLHRVACGVALIAAFSSPAAVLAQEVHQHGVARPTPSAMFVVADPKSPRIARGPRGPLWASYTPRQPGTTAMGQTFAEQYLARESAAASDQAIATRVALTTAQATKKLTKKCQKLVKAKKPNKLSKADKKARIKCLEKRRKLIDDSKKKPETKPGSSTTPTGPSGSKPDPGSSPSTGTPTPTTPAPTTPTGAPPAQTTPAAGCTGPGLSPVTVTAIDEGAKFELSTCGVKAGSIEFTLNSNDANEDHNLVIADGMTSAGGPSGTVRVVSTNISGGESATKSFTLEPGEYTMICMVDGHRGMAITFKVFPA